MNQPLPLAWPTLAAIVLCLCGQPATHQHRNGQAIRRGKAMTNYAQGGYIGRPDDDSIPLVIHPGESWVTAEQARKYGVELLQKLNGGAEVHIVDEADTGGNA